MARIARRARDDVRVGDDVAGRDDDAGAVDLAVARPGGDPGGAVDRGGRDPRGLRVRRRVDRRQRQRVEPHEHVGQPRGVERARDLPDDDGRRGQHLVDASHDHRLRRGPAERRERPGGQQPAGQPHDEDRLGAPRKPPAARSMLDRTPRPSWPAAIAAQPRPDRLAQRDGEQHRAQDREGARGWARACRSTPSRRGASEQDQEQAADRADHAADLGQRAGANAGEDRGDEDDHREQVEQIHRWSIGEPGEPRRRPVVPSARRGVSRWSP